MDIEMAKRVLMQTHIAALRNGERAGGVLLEGMPGIAKTEGTFQYAEKLANVLNEPVGIVQFMLATISSVDVKGFMLPVKNPNSIIPDTVFSRPPWFPTNTTMWVVEPNGTWHSPETWKGEVPTVGILFLDEWSQAEDEVKKPAAELLLNGNVGECRLKPGWRVIAAGNRLIDRSGVGRELMFITNRRCRFKIQAKPGPWLNFVNGLAPERKPHYMTISFAQKNPGIVFPEKVPDGTDEFCTPRSLCKMDADLRALRSDREIAEDKMPMDDLAREVATGWIGEGSAAQFFTHLRYADELPEIEDVLSKPDKARVPPNMDAQMVTGYMLAHYLDENSAGALVTYAQRLGKEMQVLSFAAMSRGKHVSELMAVPAYQRWLAANKDLLNRVNA